MTFKFCDGCDSYAATADISAKFSAVTSAAFSATGGRFGGGAITSSSVPRSLSFSRAVSVPSLAKLRLAFSMRASTGWNLGGVSSGFPLLSVNGQHVMGISTAGQLVITVLGGSIPQFTSSAIVVDNAYHWVELEYYLNGTSSTAQLYVDGISQGTLTGVNLNAAVAITSVAFSGGTTAAALTITTTLSFGTTRAPHSTVFPSDPGVFPPWFPTLMATSRSSRQRPAPVTLQWSMAVTARPIT